MRLSQVGVLVDDFGGREGGYAKVARLGELVVAEPVDRSDRGGRVAYVRDPTGNAIELFQSIPMEG